MPYDIKYEMLPVGRTLSAAKKGETVSVQSRAFFSSEDGQILVEALEGFVQDVLTLIEQQCDKEIGPHQVIQLLAIISRDKTAIVYVNEPSLEYIAECTGPIEKGQLIGRDDISRVHNVELNGVDISADQGVIFFFTLGWRRGLFYDFAPLASAEAGGPFERTYDLSMLLGKSFNRVIFQKRFSLTESDWAAFFDSGMFPFNGMLESTFEKLLGHARSGWELRELADEIRDELIERVDGFLSRWNSQPTFAPHMELLAQAVERYKEADYVSCISILMPRIEGVLRTHSVRLGSDSFHQERLAELPTVQQENDMNILLPERFRCYLEKVFFADFNPILEPCDAEHSVSRNTVSHGVAGPTQFDGYNASVCVLVLHQLYLCLDVPCSQLAL